LLLREQEIVDLRRSIEQLDAAKDELQGELDAKTEEVAEVRALMDRQAREFTQMQHHVSAITGKEDGVQRRMAEREQEIKILRAELNATKAAMEETKQIAQAKNAEVQELVEDIQTLTRENKFVNSEFTKAT
jgi:chromosome segregation ATPase